MDYTLVLAAAGRINPTPPVERFLYESPWLLMGVFAAAGIAGFWTLNRQGKTRVGLGVLGAGLVLAAAVVGVAFAIVTPREEIKVSTRALVRAVAADDRPAIERLLDDRVRFDVPGAPAELDREAVLAQVKRAHAAVDIRSGRATAVRADTRGPEIGRSLVEVWIDADTWPRSTWQIDWAVSRDEPKRWVVTRIEAVNIPGLTGRP